MEIASGGGGHNDAHVESQGWASVWPDFPIFAYSADMLLKESSTVYKAREKRTSIMFIFDTAAATSIARDLSCCIPGTFVPCNKETLKITGIGGSKIDVIGSARLLAPFSHIRVWIVPDAIANIISAIDVHSKHYTQFAGQYTYRHRIECAFDNRVVAEFVRQKSVFVFLNLLFNQTLLVCQIFTVPHLIRLFLPLCRTITTVFLNLELLQF